MSGFERKPLKSVDPFIERDRPKTVSLVQIRPGQNRLGSNVLARSDHRLTTIQRAPPHKYSCSSEMDTECACNLSLQLTNLHRPRSSDDEFKRWESHRRRHHAVCRPPVRWTCGRAEIASHGMAATCTELHLDREQCVRAGIGRLEWLNFASRNPCKNPRPLVGRADELRGATCRSASYITHLQNRSLG